MKHRIEKDNTTVCGLYFDPKKYGIITEYVIVDVCNLCKVCYPDKEKK